MLYEILYSSFNCYSFNTTRNWKKDLSQKCFCHLRNHHNCTDTIKLVSKELIGTIELHFQDQRTFKRK
ncbi:hypothetical protein BpHYR1_007163 [Brachionus plicatilis]|uniref:Uncharacterized protein n=1 Tax=Brachionus plicatilis TaxID=10195 RepID=A0A3M7S6Z4_BRAPC|nr:hypothetical protein BpHYR1_007163 [Brachionus plicatilis]